MKSLFGVPIDTLMIAMLVIFLIVTGIVAVLALLNPLLLKLGLRNIPRRRAQTILIVVGLMLSTLIITTALSTGDTVAYSIRAGVAEGLGRIDEAVTNQPGATIHGGPASYFSADLAPRVAGALRGNPGVAAVSAASLESVSVIDTTSRQSKAKVAILGVPADVAGDLGSLSAVDGSNATMAQLGPGEVYLNKVGGDPLNARAGDTLQVNIDGQATPMRLRAVLRNTGLAAGALPTVNEQGLADPEILLPLEGLQALTGHAGQINLVLVANAGDVISGATRTDAVTDPVRVALASPRPVSAASALLAAPAGQAALATLLKDASVTSDGTLKNKLTMLKGAVASVGGRATSLLSDPKVGRALSTIKDPAVAAPLNEALASISPYQVQTLKQGALDAADQSGSAFVAIFLLLSLFSIAAGVLLIVLIFTMLAAERRAEMGMARAIGTKRRHLVQQFLFEGYTYNLGAALIGVLLGLAVGALITLALNNIFSFLGLTLVNRTEPHSIAIAFCLGALLTFATVTFSAWRVSRLNVVAAIRDLPDESLSDSSIAAAFKQPFADLANAGRRVRGGHIPGAIGALLAVPWHMLVGWRVFVVRGPLPLIVGLLLITAATANHDHPNGSVFRLGGTLTIIGAAMGLRWLLALLKVPTRVRDRAGFTLAGLGTVFFYLIPINTFHAAGKPDFDTGPYDFFLTGILLVLGGVWAVMFNADLILSALLLLFGRRGTLAPTLKMAVSYPLQNKFRTGMTVAMFSLVIFLLMLFSVVLNSTKADLNLRRDVGGFATYGTTSTISPIRDVRRQVAADPTLSRRIDAAGSLATLQAGFRQAGQDDQSFRSYPARVLGADYLRAQRWTLHQHAAGYASDRAVWQALGSRPGLVVIDGDLVGMRKNNFNGGGFQLQGFDYGDQGFTPTRFQMRDPRSGKVLALTVIGVLDRNGVSDTTSGVYLGQDTLRAAGLPAATPTDYYFRLKPGQDVHQTALALGTAFLANGLDVRESQSEFDKNQATQNGFSYLLEAFMGLGLLVGVAALGVIAFRSVVERRQQIGMMRAIGFQQGMVRTGFLLENSFVAILGSVLGVVLGGLLGKQYVDSIAGSDPNAHLAIPWLQVGAIVASAYVASLIATYLPARQASRVYPAEALRYE